MKDKEFGYAMKALRMVIRREWHRMTSRRLYLGVCVVLPLLCLFFMATIFGNGQMENIPVGIVDLDNTATSRNISQRISAAPTFRVTSTSPTKPTHAGHCNGRTYTATSSSRSASNRRR